MSDETSPIVVTLKGGAGYDAPWLVIRGNNPQQVSEMLSNLGNLPEVIAQQASLFSGTIAAGPITQPQAQAPVEQAPPPQQGAWGTITPGGFQPAQQGQQWSQPPQQQGPPAPPQGVTLHPEGKQCGACGKTLQYKEVFSRAKNKTFKFWTCPDQRNRDDGHTSEFV